jgi:hypothetical protein
MTDRPDDGSEHRDMDPAQPEPEADDQAFSDEHPLASPNELAGDAASGLNLEFAARDIADAEGAASGMALDDEGDTEEDTLPLEGY